VDEDILVKLKGGKLTENKMSDTINL